MAPDIDNITQSPHPTHARISNGSAQASPNLSRRTSGIMGPPPVPQNSSLPTSPRLPSNAVEPQIAGGTAGPIRHPRPLTAAELHLELEKEQESIVNRLTRELSALRAQTASVASTTSSTSDLFSSNPPESHLYPYQSGVIPSPGRRHRSSSNLSSRSARSVREALTSSATATSVSGVAAPRERDRDRDTAHSLQTSSRPSIEIPRPAVSRQNSMSGLTMHRTPSNAAYPFPSAGSSSATALHAGSGGQQQQQQQYHSHHHHASSRHSISSNYSTYAGEHGRSPGPHAAAAAAARYEEAALHKAELDAVKKENEALKQKIRDLERRLGGRTEGTAGAGAGGGAAGEQPAGPAPGPASDATSTPSTATATATATT